jgi:transcriptional regulator with XRE-family HTH domain
MAELDRVTRRLELGDRVRRLRQEKGWTTRMLAKEAGVSDSYVSRLETGATAKPRQEDLQQVAEALGTTVFFLVEGYAPIDVGGSDRFDKLDPDLKNAAFKLVDFMEENPADKEYIIAHLELLQMLKRRK